MNKNKFSNLSYVCLFIGPNRSGTTLLSNLLDAHPDIIMANEFGLTTRFRAIFYKKLKRYQKISKNLKRLRLELISQLIESSRKFAIKKKWGLLNYNINHLQGEYKTLKIIGDKKAANTTKDISLRPTIIKKISSVFNVPVKFIWIVRNPFDIISSQALAAGYKQVDLQSIKKVIKHILQTYLIKKNIYSENIHIIFLERFIEKPKEHLVKLFHFLGINISFDWIDSSLGIVYKQPHKTREKVIWPQNLKTYAKKRLSKYPDYFSYFLENK